MSARGEEEEFSMIGRRSVGVPPDELHFGSVSLLLNGCDQFLCDVRLTRMDTALTRLWCPGASHEHVVLLDAPCDR